MAKSWITSDMLIPCDMTMRALQWHVFTCGGSKNMNPSLTKSGRLLLSEGRDVHIEVDMCKLGIIPTCDGEFQPPFQLFSSSFCVLQSAALAFLSLHRWKWQGKLHGVHTSGYHPLDWATWQQKERTTNDRVRTLRYPHQKPRIAVDRDARSHLVAAGAQHSGQARTRTKSSTRSNERSDFRSRAVDG